MIDYKFWELLSLPYNAYAMILDGWDDERRLRYENDRLRHNRFLQSYLIKNTRRVARAIDLEDRHLEFLQSQIEWNEEAIKNHEHHRKVRAWAKNKRAEERVIETEKGPLPGPQRITLGISVPPEVILSIKYN